MKGKYHISILWLALLLIALQGFAPVRGTQPSSLPSAASLAAADADCEAPQPVDQRSAWALLTADSRLPALLPAPSTSIDHETAHPFACGRRECASPRAPPPAA